MTLRVASVQEHPRKPGSVQVELSDGRRFVLGIERAVGLGVAREGVEVGGGQLAQLEQESSVHALMQRAIAALARARRTRAELELRLRRLNPDVALVRLALDRLAEKGLLQDERVAEAEAASRLRRGAGPALVKRALSQKGLSRDVIDGAMARAQSEDAYDELATCKAQAERRLRSLSSLDSAVARRRLMGYLQRRGFSASAIRSVVYELLPNRST